MSKTERLKQHAHIDDRRFFGKFSVSYLEMKPPPIGRASRIDDCSLRDVTTCCQTVLASKLVLFGLRFKISNQPLSRHPRKLLGPLPIVFFRISLSSASSLAFHSAVGIGAFGKAMITRLMLSLLPCNERTSRMMSRWRGTDFVETHVEDSIR